MKKDVKSKREQKQEKAWKKILSKQGKLLTKKSERSDTGENTIRPIPSTSWLIVVLEKTMSITRPTYKLEPPSSKKTMTPPTMSKVS